jgi:iron uptake system EfeUOB component EfeO/EfeM
MMRLIKIFAITLAFCGSMALAEDSVATAQNSSTESELKQELAVRDSVMQVQGNACTMEKDSLRAVIDTEKAKSENWEKSYNTIKKDNEMCAQALSVSIGVNEKKKEQDDNDRRAAAMMTSSSFLGGIGIGLLIMWLIMK